MGNKPLHFSPKSNCGTFHNYSYYFTEVQGWRTYMEDCTLIHDQPEYQIFAIFDGHGGDEVSKFLQEYFVDMFQHEYQSNFSDIVQTIFSTFKKLDDIIALRVRSEQVGSTALVVIITETLIYIANLGDCRALYRKYYGFEVLTTDHDAINEEERVIKAGGFIKDGRVNGSLIVARSFGDYFLKKTNHPIISVIPEIKIIERPRNGEYIVLGSDGLWECLKNENVIEYIDHCYGKHVLESLFKSIIAKNEDGDVGYDNMSGIIIQF